MKAEEAIVVLHYNKIRLTLRCVQSILDAGYSPEQVYCFDNGSKPEVFAELKETFPEVQHLRTGKNHGFSGGFNRALKWVFSFPSLTSALFCTNDTVISPHALEECSQMGRQTGAGMVAPCITYLSHPDSIDSIGAYVDFENCTIRHYHDRDLPLMLEPGKEYIPGTALWIHRDTFDTLGGADESYHTYWEDVDMSFRAHAKNIPLARCYQAKIGHGVGQTCHKKPLYTTFYFQRNRIRFFKRFLSGDVLEKILQQILRELQESGARWQEKGDTKRLKYLDRLLEEIKIIK
ncbi:glycosyltransferase family 2 protein [Acidobacteriota bacterium]